MGGGGLFFYQECPEDNKEYSDNEGCNPDDSFEEENYFRLEIVDPIASQGQKDDSDDKCANSHLIHT